METSKKASGASTSSTAQAFTQPAAGADVVATFDNGSPLPDPGQVVVIQGANYNTQSVSGNAVTLRYLGGQTAPAVGQPVSGVATFAPTVQGTLPNGTISQFTQPAIGATVAVNYANAPWVLGAVGLQVVVPSGGVYQVTASTGAAITLRNDGATGNAPATTVIAATQIAVNAQSTATGGGATATDPAAATTAGFTVPAVGATVDVPVNYLPSGMNAGDADKESFVNGLTGSRLQATAIGTQTLRLKNTGFATPGEVLSFGKAVGLLGGQSPAYKSDPKVEFWIPDYLAWEDTAVVAPLQKSQVFRVGATLYMFGGHDGAANSAVIYSAAYDASGTVPVFVTTGLSLPAVANGLRVVLVGSTLYSYAGKSAPTTAIWSAPLATPTVWTATGFSIARRDNAPIVVSSTRISLIGGHDGTSGYNSVQSALLATPTTIVTSAGVMNNNWEAGAAIIGSDTFVYFGGTGTEITALRKAKASILNLYGTIPSVDGTYWPSNMGGSPELFSNGDHHCAIGSATVPSDALVTDANMIAKAQRGTTVLTRTSSYLYGGTWIGGDGRAYFISTDGTKKIQRSYRKRVYVRASEVNAANAIGPYSPLIGVTEEGTPAVVSTHVRMGSPPWLTDRRTAF